MAIANIIAYYYNCIVAESKLSEARAQHEHNVKQTSFLQQQQGTKLCTANT